MNMREIEKKLPINIANFYLIDYGTHVTARYSLDCFSKARELLVILNDKFKFRQNPNHRPYRFELEIRAAWSINGVEYFGPFFTFRAWATINKTRVLLEIQVANYGNSFGGHWVKNDEGKIVGYEAPKIDSDYMKENSDMGVKHLNLYWESFEGFLKSN